MEAAKRAMCVDDPINPLITTTLQASGILVISHFFHIILKPMGQPGPVAQILVRPKSLYILRLEIIEYMNSFNIYNVKGNNHAEINVACRQELC